MALTIKKLDKIEKQMQAVFADDPANLATVVAKLDGVRAAVQQGETITKADLGNILGEVEITKINQAAASAEVVDDPSQNPLAPIFYELHKMLVDRNGTIRKGIDTPTLQDILNVAFQKAADVLDGGIDAAVEATAIELAKAGRIAKAGKGKGKGKNFGKDPDDEDCDDGDGSENMEKLLKSLGPAGGQVMQILRKQSMEIAGLQAERDIEVFKKHAEEIGEGDGFATDLLKLHRVDPALAERISKRLGAKNKLLKQGDMWSREIGGSNLGETGTAYEKISAHAQDLISKGIKDDGGKPLTFAKAFTLACAQKPDLYAEYKDEQRRGR